MDRRSIIFIIGMTALFFLMNQWFNSPSIGSPEISPPKTNVEFIGDRPAQTLSQREMQKLGLVRLYRDVDLKEFVTYAASQASNYLTIAPAMGKLPNTVYVKDPSLGTNIVQRVEIRVKGEKAGDPVLYSLYPLEKLIAHWMPSDGEYQIKALLFDDDEVKVVNGTSYGVERAIFETMVPSNALLAFNIDGTYFPYGYFLKESRSIEYLNDVPAFEDFAVLTAPAEEVKISKEGTAHYVLENDYFQLVFSSLNGAISEINLPFQSDSHPNSVVREIQFDRILQKDYPDNDRFPQFPSQISLGNGKTESIDPKVGGYYPLLRRDTIGATGLPSVEISPHYYATTIFERDIFPFIEEYKVTRFEKDLIEFTYSDSKRRITKTFTLPKNPQDSPYCFDLAVNIEGDTRKLVIATGIPEVELISGSFNPTFKYRVRKPGKPKIDQFKVPKSLADYPSVDGDWYCNGNGFFGVILDALNREVPGATLHPVSGELVPTRLTVIDAEHNRYPAEKYPGYAFHIPIMAKPGKTHYRFFTGPFDKTILTRVDTTYTNPTTGYNPYYSGAQSYHGWFAFISQPFAKFLFVIMNFFHSITNSWGISIILLTVVLRIMLFPLNNWSMKSNAKLQKIAPKVKELQDKYKKDQKRMQMEIMNLYRKEKVNPFGGCFPILIQLPFLFGMFDLLKSSFELRGASFIPGWINNLTAPDVLFSWGYPLPFFGTSFHLLPILLGVIMYYQQKFMSAGKVATDQQKQQRSIGNIMTIVFTVMFYHFPSGLNLYWISSMGLGILQQWYVNKKIEAEKR